MLTRLSVGILAAFAIASAVAAEGYPSKPIAIVVPFAAGGPLVCLYLESLAGIKLRHVPYRSW
jgi:hypothetical protein